MLCAVHVHNKNKVIKTKLSLGLQLIKISQVPCVKPMQLVEEHVRSMRRVQFPAQTKKKGKEGKKKDEKPKPKVSA